MALQVLGVIIYSILFVELTFGWRRNPKKKFYQRLFNIKTYLLTLACSVLLWLVPIYYILNGQGMNFTIFFFTPFIYLLLFKAADYMSKLINKRHIIIVSRWDIIPREHNWKDCILAFLSVFGSIALTMVIRAVE